MSRRMIARKASHKTIAIGGDNVAKLRDRIDHGEAGDKVDFPDPAAAPLGTDEEAAGTRSVTGIGNDNAPALPTARGTGSRKAGGSKVMTMLFLASAITAIALIVAISL